jgi:predicted GIY-YIG superfamily endonuclease
MMTSIHQYPHLDLRSRELLPENSGVYYILDDDNIVWYIGKAKNLKVRWSGAGHHRLAQLQKQVKKRLIVYYELVAEPILDQTERQRIEQYSPQLNGTKVKSQKSKPIEVLLRETLTELAPYLYVIGVEPPRKEDNNFVNDAKKWNDAWRIQASVLHAKVIHIGFDSTKFNEDIGDGNLTIKVLNKIFRHRPNFTANWDCKATKRSRYISWLPITRLFCNGFAIEMYEAKEETIAYLQNWNSSNLAGVKLKAISDKSLESLKVNEILILGGLSKKTDNSNYQAFCNRSINRLTPYRDDAAKVLFDRDFNPKEQSVVQQLKEKEEQIDQEGSSRITNLNKKRKFMLDLLSSNPHCDLNKYATLEALQPIDTTHNYPATLKAGKMPIYIQPFSCDLQEVRGPVARAKGSQGEFICIAKHHPYQRLYLEGWVEKSIWLLLEPHIHDFAKVHLSEDEGSVQEYFVSTRKKLFHAVLRITLDKTVKAEIPFGSDGVLGWVQATNIIAQRLNSSEIEGLKFTFKAEEAKVK